MKVLDAVTALPRIKRQGLTPAAQKHIWRINEVPDVRGAGGGGKDAAGGASTPTEDPDSLQSVAFVSFLDLVCEGQSKGLVVGPTGAQTDSIYLDAVGVTSNGFPNYNGCTVAWVNGTQTQGVIPGFDDVSSTVTIGTETKFNVPIQSAITNEDADTVEMTISVSGLYLVDTSTGNVHGSSVELALEYQPGGSANWITAADILITGKTRSKYERTIRFGLTGAGPWIVRARRITPDSTSSALVNNTFLDAVTTIESKQLNYPNSALVAVNIDARQFSSIPARSYLFDGLLIQVPNNYDPDVRSYTGGWDGGFKIAFSDNPAWCLYDMLNSTRYGLGRYLRNAVVDKVALYEIGQYCDEMVPDGFGGIEPRFQLNTAITNGKEAYQVVQDLCSVFRGMTYWQSGNITVTQDAPRTPGRIFTPANVIDGKFHYEGSALKDRHSVALVRWNDPAQKYTQATEYVQNNDAFQRYGYRSTTIMAVGTTTRGQAHRLGQWALTSEISDTDKLTFSGGLDASKCVPGEIVSVIDPVRAARRMGGRVMTGSVDHIQFDAPVQFESGQTYVVDYYDADGAQHVGVPLINPGVSSQVAYFVTPVADVPYNGFMWMITASNLVPQTFRVINVKETARNTFELSTVTYNASKYSAIDFNTKLQIPQTGLGDGLSAGVPTNWSVFDTTYLIAPGVIGSKVITSWTGNTTHYMAQWRVNGGGWQSTTLRSPTLELDGVTEGDVYDFKIYGMSSDTTLSQPLEETYTIAGKSKPPAAPTSLTATGDFRAANLAWAASADLDIAYFQVFYSTVNNIAAAALIGDKVGSTMWSVGGLTSTVPYYFWVREVDTSGNIGPFNSNVGTVAVPLQGGTLDIQNLSVVNAKIGTEAVGTSNIMNAAITAALIGSAQIVTAHIGVAQIDTLRIAGNAVTTNFATTLGAGGGSVGYNAQGGVWTVAVGQHLGGPGTSPGSGAPGIPTQGLFSFYIDGVLIQNIFGTNSWSQYVGVFSGYGAGGHTLTVTSSGGTTGIPISVFEAKR